MEVCWVCFETAGSPVSNKAHRASLHASASKYQGCLQVFTVMNLAESEVTISLKLWMLQEITTPVLSISCTFTGKFLLNTSVQGAMFLFVCLFVSGQGWKMITWGLTQFQSVIWTQWEANVRDAILFQFPPLNNFDDNLSLSFLLSLFKCCVLSSFDSDSS